MTTSRKTANPELFPFDLVRPHIEKVEALIRDQVRAFDPGVEPYMEYICDTSGKRIRPALTVLTGGATGGLQDEHVNLGVILELIHMATLVHDDIIDGASSRRKVPTANAKWGNGMAVLLGDALFSHALKLSTDFENPDLSRAISLASREVCQGEILQTQRRFDLTLTKKDYFKKMGLTQDITQPEKGSQEDITKPEASITLPPGTTLPQNMNQDVDDNVKDEVKIIQDPVTGIITLVGSAADVEIVRKVIAEISSKAKARQALVERIPLEYLLSSEIAEQIQEIYDASYAPSTGAAKIQALSSPNAIVVVGQPAGIEAVQQLVGSMDVVATASELGGFEAIPLKYLSAADAKTRLDSYFNQANAGQGTQLASTPIAIIADFRSNSIIVKGPKEVIAQALQVLETIDVAEVDGKTNTVKVFPLRNTLAEEMAIVLQDAISGQQPNAGQGYNPNQQAQQNQQNANQQIQPTQSSLGAAQLSLRTIDKKGKEVKSGIMFDVRVTADRNSNSLARSTITWSIYIAKRFKLWNIDFI